MFYTESRVREPPTFLSSCYIERESILSIMETSDSLRHRVINNVMALHSEKNAADAAINIWRLMASEIISIVGESGFNSLYARSLFIARPEFPWLAEAAHAVHADSRFTELKNSFENKTPAQITKANLQLLIVFTDIVASVIGEQLTMSILRSAWGNDVWNRSQP